MERLEETLLEIRSQSARGVLEHVIKRVAKFAKGAPQSDDITLRRGGPERRVIQSAEPNLAGELGSRRYRTTIPRPCEGHCKSSVVGHPFTIRGPFRRPRFVLRCGGFPQ